MIDVACLLSGLLVSEATLVVIEADAGCKWQPSSYLVDGYYDGTRIEFDQTNVRLLSESGLQMVNSAISTTLLHDGVIELSNNRRRSVSIFSREVIKRVAKKHAGAPLELCGSPFYKHSSSSLVREAAELGRVAACLEATGIDWAPVRVGQVDDEAAIRRAVARFATSPVILSGLVEYVREYQDESMTRGDLLSAVASETRIFD